MSEKKVFVKNGSYVVLTYDGLEIYEHFYERGLFIVSLSPKNLGEFEHYELYSRMFVQNKYFGCEYGDEDMKELKRLIYFVYP